MANSTPYCPSGAVSFCKTFGPLPCPPIPNLLETEEALEDYAKFCSSLMETYTSLTMSISSDNEVFLTLAIRTMVHYHKRVDWSLVDELFAYSRPQVLMGLHCRNELKRLESYKIAANVRSLMKVTLLSLGKEETVFHYLLACKAEYCAMAQATADIVRHDTDVHQLMMGSKVQGFTSLLDEDGKNVREYSYHLKRLHILHQLFAFRKSLAKRDFIKWDSDFDEVFQRLKSEQQWTHFPDDILRFELEDHFSLLRKLNDNSGMGGLVSVSNMSEGDKLLEAINSAYSQEVSDLFKDFKEKWMKRFFSQHMEVKLLQRKLFNQAELSRTAIIPKDCHFTTRKISSLKSMALVHKSLALGKIQELKGRWGSGFGALRGRLLPAGVFLVCIPVAYIGGKECKRVEDKKVNGRDCPSCC